MIQQVMKFEKVSFNQFVGSLVTTGYLPYLPVNEKDTLEKVQEWYDNIKLPERATSGSTGYDFYSPIQIDLESGTVIPTGIRCKIDPGWMLMLCPRSGLGTKIGFSLKNTVGIIDSDYYYALNEGHILTYVKVDKPYVLKQGERFMQGIALPYGLTIDDSTNNARTGGFGSTGRGT